MLHDPMLSQNQIEIFRAQLMVWSVICKQKMACLLPVTQQL